MRALDRSPTKRFLTVRQFVDEVARVGHGEVIELEAPRWRAGGSPDARRPSSCRRCSACKGGRRRAVARRRRRRAVRAAGRARASVTAGAAAADVAGAPAQRPRLQRWLAAPCCSAAPGRRHGRVRSRRRAPVGDDAADAAAGADRTLAVGRHRRAAAAARPQWPRPPRPRRLMARCACAAGRRRAGRRCAGQAACAAVVARRRAKKKGGGEERARASSARRCGSRRATSTRKPRSLPPRSARAPARKAAHDKADSLPIDERYKDDGSISREDKEKYSLRTGATQMMSAIKSRRR